MQRLTVYNHFPDLRRAAAGVLGALAGEHPLPDLGAALALEDPVERLRAALTALYGWYRENAPMQRRVLGERATVPELDAWMARSADLALAELADRLAGGFDAPRRAPWSRSPSTSGPGSASTARGWTTPRPPG